jgi:hypothetical protein
LAAGAIFLFYFFDRFLSLFFKVFVTASLHQLQLNFSNDLSNMPTSVVQLKKIKLTPISHFSRSNKRDASQLSILNFLMKLRKNTQLLPSVRFVLFFPSSSLSLCIGIAARSAPCMGPGCAAHVDGRDVAARASAALGSVRRRFEGLQRLEFGPSCGPFMRKSVATYSI